MFIPNSEQTSEKGELEGAWLLWKPHPGEEKDPHRCGTGCGSVYHQGREEPRTRRSQALVEEGEVLLAASRGHGRPGRARNGRAGRWVALSFPVLTMQRKCSTHALRCFLFGGFSFFFFSR